MKTNRSSSPAGAVTLPGEAGHEKEVLALFKAWGADAIRDCDGTQLSQDLLDLGAEVYATYCIVRANQELAREFPEFLPLKFLMSDSFIATSSTVSIELMRNYYPEKYRVYTRHDPHPYWEVIDRTTGDVVDPARWTYKPKTGCVVVRGATPYHRYTANFLVEQIWDSVSMYNYLTNNWTGPHIVSVDPYHPECRKRLMDLFDRWLEAHADTDVVRFTTFAYLFTLDSNKQGLDRYRDWLGYTDTISIPALEDFAREYGYRLRSEDIVDQGYYNNTARVPSQAYRDWMEFIQRFVIEFSRELTDRVHRAGKRTAMFQGDHWIGTEPFSPGYQKLGIDINIGAVEDGVALRRLSDSPGKQLREARFYPYFFPDVFREGGDPLGESLRNWVKIRRALLREPIDRIGYGGYLSLATKFPDFVEHVAAICGDFRELLRRTGKERSRRMPVKVMVLNAWGELRAWLQNACIDQKFHVPSRPDVMEFVGSNPLECLAGLPLEVIFRSFADLKQNGIPKGVNAILNMGDAGTSWSGGDHWADPEVTTLVRQFVCRGGGFVGIGDPSACSRHGQYFQLADLLGVEKEIGNTMGVVAYRVPVVEGHFINRETGGITDMLSQRSNVYVADGNAQVLEASGIHVNLACNTVAGGRTVYFSQLPYSLDNARLLLRALLWATRREDALQRCHSTNPNVDSAFYPKAGVFCLANNVDSKQVTTVFDANGAARRFTLQPYQWRWEPQCG